MLRRIKNGLFKNFIPSFNRKIKRKVKKEQKINLDFYNDIDNLIQEIPTSMGSNYYKKADISIGVITDEYMYNYYKDAINLVYIDYSNYREIVDKVDYVLFISCWRGMKNNDWRGFTNGEPQKRVIEVFKYAKSKNKKTIFQTIEDPSNYEVYLNIAKNADYIFTTAVESIEDYKKDTNNENVFLLDYGVNPQIHNPVGINNSRINKKNILFAGSWAPKYWKRCRDAITLFDGVIKSKKKLIIIDRNYNIKGYEFPNKYYKYIIPAVEHKKLQKVHKLFEWTLNLNSIKYSKTMCAMRTYEMQALGNLIISNYSIAVSNNFPNIFIGISSEEIVRILNSYNEIDKYIMQVEGVRNVMSYHTVYDKLNYIFTKINETKAIFRSKTVLVICNELNEKIEKMFNSQTYIHKEISKIEDIENQLFEKYDYIAYFDDNIEYGRHYLEDMINAFKYTNSDFITIASKIINNEIVGTSHDYVKESAEISKTVFDINKYDVIEALNKKSIVGKGYAIDPFQISVIRNEYDEEAELSVIIPIYNNGKFLLNKCFSSLKRSSIFRKMEIILVDDGSSDIETIQIIKDIEKSYSNVKTYFFDDGGSGSASRPRNKGVELASTDYITYLDPDNEAINDGYAILFEIIKESNYDFVFGGIVKLSDDEKTFSYDTESKIITKPRKELLKKNFQTNSIQACIIKKDLIIKNNICNPIGAAGQDSFFFQELMINARRAYYLNMPIHIYYASRNDSVVNSITHKFYEKFLIMERYQVNKLKEYNLLDEYKKRRYQYFLDNWYLEKLKLIKDEKEYEISKDIIKQIKELYI